MKEMNNRQRFETIEDIQNVSGYVAVLESDMNDLTRILKEISINGYDDAGIIGREQMRKLSDLRDAERDLATEIMRRVQSKKELLAKELGVTDYMGEMLSTDGVAIIESTAAAAVVAIGAIAEAVKKDIEQKEEK